MNPPPLFTVVMPTYNSVPTLQRALASVRQQDIGSDQVEVLVVDGGSQDRTRQLATEAGATVLDNPRTQQEYAKHIGLLAARGEYVVFLDSDEVLAGADSLARRARCFTRWPEVHLLLFSGYRRPPGTATVNEYINFFSDPFAWFMYRLPAGEADYARAWRRRYRVADESVDGIRFEFAPGQALPLVDLCAGNTVRRDYLPALGPDVTEDPLSMANLFYLVATRTGTVAMLKEAPTVHYSAESWRSLVRKLRWRVVANIHYRRIPGTGFANREAFQPAGFRARKYLFPVYALTLVVPLIESIWHALRRRSPVLLWHLPLTVLTALMIAQQYALKLIGRRPVLRTYGREDRPLSL
ncbi:glycosyltransferase family 2 protein [bacterium]|nr:glycosyltransferase family 2 protein [bacterium]